MTTPFRRVETYAQQLYENGLETVRPGVRDPNNPHASIENAGGCKMWQVYLNSDKNQVRINHKGLDKALRELPVLLFTCNRVEFRNGEPVHVQGSDGYNRILQSLMVYPQYDEDPQTAIDLKARLQEILSDVPGAKDRIELFSNLRGVNHDVVRQHEVRTSAGENFRLKPDFCIFLALQSGQVGGNQIWGIEAKKDRQSTSSRTSVTGVEAEGLPL